MASVLIGLDGTVCDRVSVGEEPGCSSCGRATGELHGDFWDGTPCDLEACPLCGDALVECECTMLTPAEAREVRDALDRALATVEGGTNVGA